MPTVPSGRCPSYSQTVGMLVLLSNGKKTIATAWPQHCNYFSFDMCWRRVNNDKKIEGTEAPLSGCQVGSLTSGCTARASL